MEERHVEERKEGERRRVNYKEVRHEGGKKSREGFGAMTSILVLV